GSCSYLFNHDGRSSAAAIANSRHPISALVGGKDTVQCGYDTRTGTAEGMPQRNGSAEYIQFLIGKLQFALIGNGYRRKGFVNLIIIDLIGSKPGIMKCLGNGQRRGCGKPDGVLGYV